MTAEFSVADRRYLSWCHGDLRVAVSTRVGGESEAPYDGFNLAQHVGDDPRAVERNRLQLAQDLKLPGTPPIQWLNQVHGDRVLAATPETARMTPDADAAWSAGDVAVAVLTADCLPVVLTSGCGAVGVAHCGWRGLAAGLISKLADALPTPTVAAFLAPAIGACCYQVDEALLEHFPNACNSDAVFPDPEPGKVRLSLVALAQRELVELGVTEVGSADRCSRCDPLFYSYRREAVTGRFATLAWRIAQTQ